MIELVVKKAHIHQWIQLTNDKKGASHQCSICKVKGYPSPHGLKATPYNGN